MPPLPCDSTPCENNAECTNNEDGSGYTCTCKKGYTGVTCETSKFFF